ncbi:MAG: NUDIX domain-containing protein [Hyphomicrobiaceae bacterium]|nr:MAG: NUDIX domain-containing protein [Hyphomicrobiaceae bacterium]
MKVGTAVIICKDGCVLLGLRKGPHGRGTWGFPGGALDDEDVEPGECMDQAALRGALRECAEEIGTRIKFSQLFKHPTLPYTVRKFANGQCWTTLYFVAFYVSGEPVLVEPDKFERWEWFPVDALPANIFETVASQYLDVARATKKGAQPTYNVVNVPEKPRNVPFVVLPERGRQVEEMTFMGGTLVNVRFRPESFVDTPQAGLATEPDSDNEC